MDFEGFVNAAFDGIHVPVAGVDISPSALIIHRTTDMGLFIGNSAIKELHAFTDHHWIDKMNPAHMVVYADYEEALAQGYNGCLYCFGQFDTG